MAKRLSKSDHRRQIRKEKIKKLRKANRVIIRSVKAPAEFAAVQTNLVFPALLICLGAFVLMPWRSDMPGAAKKVSAEAVKTESKKEIQIVGAVAEKNISRPAAPTAPRQEKIQAVASVKIARENKKNPEKDVLALLPQAEKINIPALDEDIAFKRDDQKKIDKLRKEILAIVKDRPIRIMADDIAKRDRQVAAFLVGIALKESAFGVHTPKNAKGEECYNFWGYRGREKTTGSGYSCFDTPAQAVKVVGDRIETFIKQGRTTPAKMVVWKCGYSCAAFTPESVDSWISDVSINFNKLHLEKDLAERNR